MTKKRVESAARKAAAGVSKQVPAAVKPVAVKPPRSALFRSLVQNSYDTIVLLDEDARITYATPAVTRVLGYEPRDIVGLDALSLVHPDDGPLVETAFARMLTQGRNRGTTYRCRTKDGDWRWLESNATNLLHDTAVRAVVLNSRDVTERRQAEIERTTNLALFDALLQNMPSGLLVVESTGRVFAANAEFCRMFGLTTSCAELAGMEACAVLEQVQGKAAEPLEFSHRVEDILRFGAPVFGEMVYLADGGVYERDYYPIYARSWSPAQWETLDEEFYQFYEEERAASGASADRFVGHCWRYHDVTERYRLELRARQSEARFHAAVEAMQEGFIILSAVRDDSGRVVDLRYEYINEAASRTNGFGPEQHVGRTLLEVLPHVRHTTLLEQYARVIETGEPLRKKAAMLERVDAAGRPQRRYFDYQVMKLDDGIAVTGREVTEYIEPPPTTHGAEHTPSITARTSSP